MKFYLKRILLESMIFMEELRKKFNLNNKKIWVAGETGMVGKAILKQLKKKQIINF